MESRIIKGDNQTMKQILKLTQKESWAEQNRNIKKELNITEADIKGTKYHLIKTLQNNTRENMEKKDENNRGK